MCDDVDILRFRLAFKELLMSPLEEPGRVSRVLDQVPVLWIAHLRIKSDDFQVVFLNFHLVEAIFLQEISLFISDPIPPELRVCFEESLLPVGLEIKHVNWVGFVVADDRDDDNLAIIITFLLSNIFIESFFHIGNYPWRILEVIFFRLFPNIVRCIVPSPQYLPILIINLFYN